MAELQLRSDTDGSDNPDLTWQPLVLSEANINHFWLGLVGLPLVLHDVFGNSRQGFMDTLLSPRNLFFELGAGEGIIACLNVVPMDSCVVYPVMFDRHLRGKEAVFKQVMSYLFHLLKLNRVTAFVNSDCETTGKFLRRCGFVREGRMRCTAQRESDGGYWVDQIIYGLLKEEL